MPTNSSKSKLPVKSDSKTLTKVKHVDLEMIHDNMKDTFVEYQNKFDSLLKEMGDKLTDDIIYKFNQHYWCPICTVDFEELQKLLDHYVEEHFDCPYCSGESE